MTGVPRTAECGTDSGYQRHRRLDETPCDDCLKARAQYTASRRAADPAARARDRWWNKTRHAALERLAEKHPREFERLLEEVREEKRAENPLLAVTS